MSESEEEVQQVTNSLEQAIPPAAQQINPQSFNAPFMPFLGINASLSTHNSQYPSAAELTKLDQLVPGAAREILDMAKKQQEWDIEAAKKNFERLERIDGANIIEQQAASNVRSREVDMKEAGQRVSICFVVVLGALSMYFAHIGRDNLSEICLYLTAIIPAIFFLQKLPSLLKLFKSDQE